MDTLVQAICPLRNLSPYQRLSENEVQLWGKFIGVWVSLSLYGDYLQCVLSLHGGVPLRVYMSCLVTIVCRMCPIHYFQADD